MRTETLDEFRYLKIWLVQTTSRCVRISVEATYYTPQVIGYGSSWISMLFITPKVFNIKARGRAAQPRGYMPPPNSRPQRSPTRGSAVKLRGKLKRQQHGRSAGSSLFDLFWVGVIFLPLPGATLRCPRLNQPFRSGFIDSICLKPW